jgi:hypothetical protein
MIEGALPLRRTLGFASTRGAGVGARYTIRILSQRHGDSPTVNSRAVSFRLGTGLWFRSFQVRRQSWFRSWAVRPRLWSLRAEVHWSHSPRVLRRELTNLMQPSSSSPHSNESGLSDRGIVESSRSVGYGLTARESRGYHACVCRRTSYRL